MHGAVRAAKRVGRGVLAATIMGLVLAGASPAVTPEPLVASRFQEWEPAAADGYLAWAQTSAKHPRHFDVVMRTGDGDPVRVNPRRSAAAHPSIDLGNPHLGDVMVVSLGRDLRDDARWDLAFFDVQDGTRLPALSGLNTRRAEREPSISGDQLLFARGEPTGSELPDTVLLYDLTDGSVTKLDSASRGVANAGAVAGDWATWQKCGPHACFIFRRQLSTGVTSRLHVAAPILWSPTVTSNGTVFVVRSGHACGQRSRIVRVPVLGPARTVAAFPPGVDASDLDVFEHDGAVDLYFSRVTCRDFDFDVYRITDVESA